MLHNERKMWYSMALVGNFESEIDEGNIERGGAFYAMRRIAKRTDS